MIVLRVYTLLVLLFIAPSSKAFGQKLSLYDLKCGGLVNPLGIDTSNIFFSWKINTSLPSVMQKGYEIRVLKNKKVIWNSGKVYSEQSSYVKYRGEPLLSATKYYWQVRIWDNKGKISEWSELQSWETGFLNSKEWKARWIQSGLSNTGQSGPVVQFRKPLYVNSEIKRARLYVTAHGIYDVLINNKRVSDTYLAPGWTSYKKRMQYQIYDITPYLVKDGNAIGIRVAEGWFRGNLSTGRNYYGREEMLLAQILIEYTNGKTEIIGSDDSWKASINGPIRMSDLYNGEIYDARKHDDNWTNYHYDDSTWKNSKIDSGLQYNHLVLSEAAPVRIKEFVKPIKIISNKKGEKIIDFGQNLVGWVRFTVNGEKGDSIILRHAEVLDKNGDFYTENLRTAKQEIKYFLKGGGRETYQPHFTFQGFRYVKVQDNNDLLSTENIEAAVIYTDMEMTGSFESSHILLNKLQSNIQWGQKGNFVDIPTDCPQRNERNGWVGDAQVFFNTAAFNMDVSGFFKKWLNDLKADQFDDGRIPHVVPYYWRSSEGGAAGWADAATIIPWNFYRIYGDINVLLQQYQSIKSWLNYMNSSSVDNLWNTGEHFGDWLFYAPKDDLHGQAAVTNKYLIAQAFYINSLQIGINVAKILGKVQDEQQFSNWLEGAKSAFLREYVTPSGRLMSDTQTAYVLALEFDVLPEHLRATAAKYLAENIRKYNNHLTTGFLGTPYLCHVLSRFGYEDVAYTLLLQEEFPSWLYPVKMGATTIWERWDGIRPDGSFQNPDMNSFNHYAYGAIGDWMYKNILGIRMDEMIPGFKKIIIQPRPGGGLTYAKGHLKTIYGKIMSSWNIESDKIVMEIVIPPNTTANIILPKTNNISFASVEGLNDDHITKFYRMDNEDISVSVGSGYYKFSYPWNK